MARFGDNLRALREDLGVKQFAFAARLGYRPSTIAKMEGLEFAQKAHTVEALADKIAAAFHLEAESVLARLMAGVRSRHDLALRRRRAALDHALDEAREIVEAVDDAHQPALIESILRHARESAAHLSHKRSHK